jgi:hypothetical protein
MFLTEFLKARTYCRPLAEGFTIQLGQYSGKYLELHSEMITNKVIPDPEGNPEGVHLECLDDLAFLEVHPENGSIVLKRYGEDDLVSNIHWSDPQRFGQRIH